MRTPPTTLALLLGMLLSAAPLMASNGPEVDGGTSVKVECQRGSGMINVSIKHHRRIGKVHLVFRDAKGKTLYVEEGKAMTEELVRRFDKGMFPKGAATLSVQARDLDITETFTVQ
ncbi:MAG TPA: hypothetical protein PLL57_07185 [Flavobacteriales bacterium]|nr:hypothetical protein [Flavobacteriales bacterium]